MTSDHSLSNDLDTFVATLKARTGWRAEGLPAEAHDEDRAALARLRRCAGRQLAECPEIYPLFYRLLPAPLIGREDLEEHCFLVATLVALMPLWGEADVGSALAAVARAEVTVRGDPETVKPVERRLHVLIDCTAEELPFRLRQIVLWLAPKAAEIGAEAWLDWRQLLDDLRLWQHPDRLVQKRWARHYFSRSRIREGATTPAAAS